MLLLVYLNKWLSVNAALMQNQYVYTQFRIIVQAPMANDMNEIPITNVGDRILKFSGLDAKGDPMAPGQ